MDFSDMAESARYQHLPALPAQRIADLRPAETLAGATPADNATRIAIWRSRLTAEERVELQARGNKVREPFLPLWREPMRKRAITVAAAITVWLPAELAPYLFIAATLPVWSGAVL